MLYHLHVKDLALIDSADVEFGPGLNILTGETGAGKSILIGSINLALGQKSNRDMIRSGAEYGLVELVFGDFDETEKEHLRKLGMNPDETDGQVIIQRKIMDRRSEIRVNDETVTLGKLRSITEGLIDIHGQNEHQSLLKEGAHLKILDLYSQARTGELRRQTAEAYRNWTAAVKELSAFNLDEAAREREMDFLRYEIDEIEKAELREGEEEELAANYRKYQNSRKITGSVEKAREVLENTDFSEAVSELAEALRYDPELKGISDSFYDLQSVADDTLRDVDAYLSENDFDEETFQETEERLDFIRSIMAKYGGSVQKTEEALAEKQARLKLLSDYDEEKQKASEKVRKTKERLQKFCRELSAARKKEGAALAEKIREEMNGMGFLDVRFEYSFSDLPEPTENGSDEAHFIVSLNPGEPLRNLTEAASGGELSRIMLAIKTVLADTDAIPTLIFDEIDTGISGRTAEKVSEKLKKISSRHQVILITHLPQIASKADVHFEILKTVEKGRTVTRIRKLSEEESVMELARLLSGDTVTDAVLENAREMREKGKKK